MRRSSKDLKSELESLREKQLSLESHIKARLIHLVEHNPDAIVLEKGSDRFKAKCVTKQWIEGLSTDTILEYIGAIERHNAKLEPYVQASMYE